MPNPARGRSREQLTGVRFNDRLLYCFKTSDDLASGVTGVSAADLQTQLGHQIITAGIVPAGGLIGVLGANAPKPPRVSKLDRTTGRSISTFCATDRLQSAIRSGWALAKSGRTRGVLDTLRRKKVYVELFGLLYVFSCVDETYNELGQLLGLKDAAMITTATEFERVVYGASYPRPGKAYFKKLSGAGSSRNPEISSFYDPEKSNDIGPLALRMTQPLYPVVGGVIA